MGKNYNFRMFVVALTLSLLMLANLSFGQTGNKYAISLDGAESFYVNDDVSNHLDLTGSYTFECWFNVDNYQAYDRIFDRRTVCAMSIIAANGTGDFALRFTDRGSSHNVLRTLETDAAHDMNLDTWYHVAVTYDATSYDAKLYINGSLAASANSSYWDLSASTNALNIGGLYNSGYSNQIDAHIDEVRVSNIARDISDMQTDYSREEYSSDANTVLLMHLDDKGDSPTYVSGNGLTGTRGDDDIDYVDYVDSRIGSPDYLLRPNYRSKATGNWSDPSTWDYYKDGTTWTAATLVPDAYTPEIAIQGGYTVTSSGSLNIKGQFSVASGSTFTDNGTTEFNGTAAQTIPIATYNNLTIDNSNGVTLDGAVSVKGTLTLTDGIVNTTSTNLLTINNGGSVSGASNTSYVAGPMKKIGNSAFTFPVGDGNYLAEISISAPSAATDAFEAEYTFSNPHTSYDTSSHDASLHNVSGVEYWELGRTVGSSSVKVKLSYDDTRSSGTATPLELRVAHWDGSTSKWINEGGSGSGGSSGTVETTNAISSFSPFTLSSTTSGNALPVEFLDFNLTNQNNVINLNWQTASEINNQGFEIQRSADNINWEDLGFVSGAGNSNILRDYDFTDNTPQQENYYRLKQVDFDGAVNYSEIKYLKMGETLSVSTYPNPVAGVLNMDIENAKQLKIYDITGKMVMQLNDNLSTIDVRNLNKGYYFFVVVNEDGSQARGSFMKE